MNRASWPAEANQKRWGDPIERFWNRVNKSDDCWMWTGLQNGRGYGRVYWEGRARLAHNVAYILANGSMPPDGLEIDHKCNTPLCVNPAHLRPMTHRDNVLRGDGIPARHARRTHCVNGHPFDKTVGGRRRCSVCDRRVSREAKRRYRAKVA